MKLKFTANSVSYEEALGGDIVQVIFDEDPDDDSISPRSKTMCASINYEFPPCSLQFEWADGPEFNGGLKAKKYTLSDKEFSVILEDGMSIEIVHSVDSETFLKISALLLREIGCPEIA